MRCRRLDAVEVERDRMVGFGMGWGWIFLGMEMEMIPWFFCVLRLERARVDRVFRR